ncbi:MAG: alpha/beta hydrolase [Rhizobacter sp.]|nr:alpha/beta hydrolase [Rhizobacter sp.]
MTAQAAGTASQAKSAPAPSAKPSIVLVHGAFADASSWAKVIPLLQKDGYDVTAVQIPLTGYAEDVATTKRVIAAQTGPVVVVGHSYGGAVITEAAANDANVKALVYIEAFAPEVGETIAAAGAKYPAPPLGTALKPDAAGFLWVDRAKFHEVFAGDVPVAEARVAAATQKPIAASSFEAAPTVAAWKSLPSWFTVGTKDEAINVDLMRAQARRAHGTIVEGAWSHVPFLSQPRMVVKVIEEAAKSAAGSASN